MSCPCQCNFADTPGLLEEKVWAGCYRIGCIYLSTHLGKHGCPVVSGECVCVCVRACVRVSVLVTRSYLNLCKPMHCSLPGSPVHGIGACVCVSVLVIQWYPTLRNPMDCSPPDSSVHGILQARILEWGAIPFSRDFSRPKDGTQVSCISGIFFTI